MPGALSSLIAYSEHSGKLAALIWQAIKCDEVGQDFDQALIGTAPEIPQEALAVLKECIEHSEDEPAARIAEIFKSLQIQHSRLADLYLGFRAHDKPSLSGVIKVLTPSNAELSIYDAALLHADIEKLFRYARGETDKINEPVERQDVERALFFFSIERSAYPGVYDLLARRMPSASPPNNSS